MTNREYYGDKILDFLESCRIINFGLNKYTDEIVSCRELDCKDCKFLNPSSDCTKITADWLKEEYCPSTDIDWSKVEVDTKILVSGDGKSWHRRYFAGLIDNKVFAFRDGTTSWSHEIDAIGWKYAKLYDESEE